MEYTLSNITWFWLVAPPILLLILTFYYYAKEKEVFK